MYKIIGADGRQYGPISAEQLRQWIAQGRANAQTKTLAEGAMEWKPLGAVPEFVSHFAPQVPPTIAPPPAGHFRKTNSFATWGMILGILSITFMCCCGGIPFNVLGLIFSIVALLEIYERPDFYEGRGFAIAGLVLSAVSLLILLAVLAAGHSNVALDGRQLWNQ
jgi:Domain of unknown function (DUF4190)/GYF domain 2